MKSQTCLYFFFLCLAQICFSQEDVILKIQKGHVASVVKADFSPDGKKIATLGGYADGLLVIWDVETARELLNQKVSNQNLSSVKFSPDGRYVIITDDSKTTKIINIQSGKTFREHEFEWIDYDFMEFSFYAEFSPKNKYYLIACFEEIHVLDRETGKVIAEFSNDGMMPSSAKFSPDENIIVVSYKENGGIIRIFDITLKELVKELTEVDNSLNDAYFDSEKKVFYSKGDYLKTWSLESYQMMKEIKINPYGILSPDNLIYASPTNWDETKVFDVKSNKEITLIPETERVFFSQQIIHNKDIRKYYLVAIPRNYVVVYNDMVKNYVELYEITVKKKKATISKLKQFEGQVEKINVIKAGNNNKLLSGGDFYLNLWDLEKMKNTHRYTDHIQPIITLDMDSVSKNFVSGTSYCFVKMWNTDNAHAVKKYEWDGFLPVYQLIFGTDKNTLLAGRKGGNSMIWNYQTDTIETTFLQKGTYGSSEFSPYGKYIATPTWDSVFIFNTETGKQTNILARNIHEPVTQVKFSPDNKTILTHCGIEDSLVLWDIESGQPVDYFKPNSPYYDFFPDGKSIIIYIEKTVFIYDIKTKEIRLEFPVSHEIKNFDITNDQRFLITTGEAKIILWDLKTGAEIATMVTIYGENPEYIVYTPDGYYMSSKNGIKGVHFIKDNKIYLFEQFDLKYNRPDVVLERLGYADSNYIEAYYLAYLKRIKKMGFTEEQLSGEFHIPESAIENFEYMPIIDEQKIDLQLHFHDSKYKLDRYNIWINNVPVYGENGKSLRDEHTDMFVTTENLILNNGQNKIQVSCLNEKGTESYKETVTVSSEPKDKQKPDLYFIALSTSKYQQSQFNLKYAVKDGRDLSSLFASSTEEYKHIYIDTLFNEEATIENVIQLKEKLLQTQVNDQVILFVSGHGLLDNDYNFYFALHDIDFSNPAERGISYERLEWLLDSIPARKKLFMMDACHSGEVDKEELLTIDESASRTGLKSGVKSYAYRAALLQGEKKQRIGLSNSFELMQEMFTNLNRGSGAVVISAAAGDSYALESDEWNNGVFTYSVLSGLQSGHADINNDGIVNVSELREYVIENVQHLTNGRQKPTCRQENVEFDFRVW